MLQPGKALKKRPQYVIETEIGVGGFGVTYKAKHQDLNFPVVIKTPNSRLCRDANYPKFVEGFRKEGRRLADITQFHHPHIVRIIDFFEEDNLPCLVMDFVKGENLYHLVQDKGILSESIAIDYIKQIADALSLCHENGIIHRDAHPGNMILRENSNTVVLIDFGLAGNVNSQSINQAANLAFAPWEQMLETEKSASIDVYTLAASLFYLVTGDTPIASLARKLNNRTLIEPKELNSRISDRLNQAIIKGLELEPINRPQSMKDLRDLLDFVNKSVPISTPQPQPRQQQNIPTPQPQTIRLPQPENSSSFLSKVKEIFIPQSSTPQPNKPEVQLKSDVGMDYRKLRDLLKAGKWQEADEETARVMLAVAKQEEEGWLQVEHIDNFPCADLRTIDQLWVKYSNGKFGFSVQKRIYKGLGGTRSYDAKIGEAFEETVGWGCGVGMVFQVILAPEGHLPCWCGWGWDCKSWACYFFSRVETCKL
ncbi:GUN4 domain-containing protein [Sphaerospermopsis sp. FACHB-1094]|uniref:serine/threonine-protein kinase n=1 Tax=Sphaerospermopsis sp. FACHB-1094 TaxID=2692861 RepID=UPI001687198F|nr:serine/threonine-protein kinase [Sphaerospermopsis sp. FACHB-1094]MBD2134732.1 GUN4 domain-containing protein [Sphaerospermopsis sp. FACHB-1094]